MDNSFFKPVRCTYDLDLGIYSMPSIVDGFNFLQDYKRQVFETDNSIPINPSLLNIPWPSSFPAARQCKHWKECKQALETFIDEIYSLAPNRPGLLPNLHSSASLASQSAKGQAAIDNALMATVYMNPEASRSRISLIGKVFLLAWLHDDVVEHNRECAGSTMVDQISAPWCEFGTDDQRTTVDTNTCLTSITQDLITEDEGVGQEMMKGLLSYILSTRSPRKKFSDFKDFVEYRALDIGSDFIFACVRFTIENLTSAEQAPLQPLITLCRDHIILVNDLFSYDKEKKDMETRGSTFNNSVNYLSLALPLETRTAKSVAQCLIVDLELQMHNELATLQRDGTLSDAQTRYALASIESAAGNLLFSVTSKRYGGDNAIDHQLLAK